MFAMSDVAMRFAVLDVGVLVEYLIPYRLMKVRGFCSICTAPTCPYFDNPDYVFSGRRRRHGNTYIHTWTCLGPTRLNIDILTTAITGIRLLPSRPSINPSFTRLFSTEPSREPALGLGCLLLYGVVEFVLIAEGLAHVSTRLQCR